MHDRPYTLLSCSMSIDGYIGGAGSRILLSNDEDLDRVDAVRASCDAILVGAGTVRVDNPRLVVRSAARREERASRGLAVSPTKVTVTKRADLDADADFFTVGEGDKLVYCASACVHDARRRLASVATVVDGGDTVDMRRLGSDLAARGVGRLMVEGGSAVHTQFLTSGLVDELQLTIAPVFLGDSDATRFVRDGLFPWNLARRAALVDVRKLGDVVLLRYALSSRFEDGP
jgi:5-amino-6-(5-phosphoribosylamino)uracil reductase